MSKGFPLSERCMRQGLGLLWGAYNLVEWTDNDFFKKPIPDSVTIFQKTEILMGPKEGNSQVELCAAGIYEGASRRNTNIQVE